MECGIAFGRGVDFYSFEKESNMRILMSLAIVLSCLSVRAADCPNGRCGVKQTVRTVTGNTVRTARVVTKGTVRVVTPPYKVCPNGNCKFR